MNVKPKDLAMVVGAPAPWAGATCTVTHTVSMPEAMVQEWGPFWGVEFARPMPCRNFKSPNEMHLSFECVMPDRLLRKIGGPDVDVDAGKLLRVTTYRYVVGKLISKIES